MAIYAYHIKRIWLGMGLLLLIEIAVLLGIHRAALIPSILLGGCTSFIYSVMLAMRVKRAAEMTVDAAVSYMRSGLAVRLMFVSLVGVMAVKIPGISFIPVLLGLFTLQIIIHVYGFYTIIRSLVFKHN